MKVSIIISKVLDKVILTLDVNVKLPQKHTLQFTEKSLITVNIRFKCLQNGAFAETGSN